MASLVRCDIWRDGGSFSATVSDQEQHRSFWLQTNQWSHPRDRGHEHLFVSDGSDPEAMQHKIEVSSTEEGKWLDFLLGVDDTGAAPESKEVFRHMIGVLQARRTNP